MLRLPLTEHPSLTLRAIGDGRHVTKGTARRFPGLKISWAQRTLPWKECQLIILLSDNILETQYHLLTSSYQRRKNVLREKRKRKVKTP